MINSATEPLRQEYDKMMIIDLIDELDLIEGIHKQVSGLTKDRDMTQLLQAAALQANNEQWQQLNLWLTQISKDTNLLLPEIKVALCSGWQGDRALSPELTHNLSS